MGTTVSKSLPKPFLEKTQLVNVVIDTPKNSSFKLKFDEESQVFRVHKAMPVGFVFRSILDLCLQHEEATAIRWMSFY